MAAKPRLAAFGDGLTGAATLVTVGECGAVHAAAEMPRSPPLDIYPSSCVVVTPLPPSRRQALGPCAASNQLSATIRARRPAFCCHTSGEPPDTGENSVLKDILEHIADTLECVLAELQAMRKDRPSPTD